jgi:hypothetical protein
MVSGGGVLQKGNLRFCKNTPAETKYLPTRSEKTKLSVAIERPVDVLQH